MIAYSLYRLEKIAWFKKNPELDQESKDKACETLIAGNHFDRFMDEARKALSAATDKAIADAVRRIRPKTFRRSVWEGIVAGLIATALAPFLWVMLYHALKLMDWWNPFVSLVDSLK